MPTSRRWLRPRRWLPAVLGLLLLGTAVAGGLAWLRRPAPPAAHDASCTVRTSTTTPTTSHATGSPSWNFQPEQVRNAAIIAAVGHQRGLSTRAIVIAEATAMQESKLFNIEYGDRDSIGLFQQRPSQGWGDAAQLAKPRFAASAFYDRLTKVKNWETRSLSDAAQAVQRSAFPDAYARWEPRAAALTDALVATKPGLLTCEAAFPRVNPQLSTTDLASSLSEALGVPVASAGQGSLELPSALPAGLVASTALSYVDDAGVEQVTIAGSVWLRSAPAKWSAAKSPAAGVVQTSFRTP